MRGELFKEHSFSQKKTQKFLDALLKIYTIVPDEKYSDFRTRFDQPSSTAPLLIQ